MSEMVERAAAAAYKRQSEMMGFGAFPPWEGLPPTTREIYVEAQKTAIATLREPTEEMIAAAVDADIPGGQYGEPNFRESSIDEDDAPIIWRAMVDEMLKE
jgi:hypothetical protein